MNNFTKLFDRLVSQKFFVQFFQENRKLFLNPCKISERKLCLSYVGKREIFDKIKLIFVEKLVFNY